MMPSPMKRQRSFDTYKTGPPKNHHTKILNAQCRSNSTKPFKALHEMFNVILGTVKKKDEW